MFLTNSLLRRFIVLYRIVLTLETSLFPPNIRNYHYKIQALKYVQDAAVDN
jgi:hypothetical protein